MGTYDAFSMTGSLMPVPFMIGILFSVHCVLICIHNESIQSCSCVFVNIVLFDIKNSHSCFPSDSMPSTERNITRSVDERFNENGKNYAFRLMIHEMMKTAVRIEMSDLL